MDTLAILVAAGRGERMRAERPKAFLPLGGAPLLLRAARALEAAPCVDALVAVVPRDEIDGARALLAPLRKLAAVVAGGARRQDSVWEGLKQAPPGFQGVVLVHDAARPLVEVALVEDVAYAARMHGAALPVLPVADTVKSVSEGRVMGTLDRATLASAQTPQGFRFPLLQRAYREAAAAGVTLTDEASAVERLGEPVHVVPGSPRNRKITAPDDLDWAEGLLRNEGGGAVTARVGTGYDAHRLVDGRPLVLGGVRVDHPRGLLGHSDGDCLAHAVCDALLGAAGAGDMGQRFPSSDPRWKGADSMSFLTEVARVLAERGYEVENIDATIVAEQPPLAAHLPAMRARLSVALGVSAEAVSVKAKTTDGLGAVGRGEGMAAEAVALLRRRG